MFNMRMRNQIDKIIITAMDRFVWFVLLVVMSHLVTEFTRVTGYGRGSRNDIIMVNDSLLQPVQVQNLVFYPGQEYGIYERPNQHVSNSNNNNNHNSNNNNNAQQNAAIITAAADSNAQQGMSFFNFRPLIDSIFEIPISTLRAVNNMVARLTGSYQQSPTTLPASGKSAAGGIQGFSSSIDNSLILENGETSNAEAKTKTIRKSILREELA